MHSSEMQGTSELQCVVFYFPQGAVRAPNYPKERVQQYIFKKPKFNVAKKFCSDTYIKHGLRSDMTALAKCLFDRYPYLKMNSHGKFPKFQGVVVFPGSADKHENEPEAFSLCAPEGFVVEETLSLFPEDPTVSPEPIPDLNLRPPHTPHLYVVAGIGQ